MIKRVDPEIAAAIAAVRKRWAKSEAGSRWKRLKKAELERNKLKPGPIGHHENRAPHIASAYERWKLRNRPDLAHLA